MENFLSSERIKAIQDANNEKYEIAILVDGLQDKSIDCDIKLCVLTILIGLECYDYTIRSIERKYYQLKKI